jgi:poly-gamma-glutamate synthesis protein (capsule biosynthesis protein)
LLVVAASPALADPCAPGVPAAACAAFAARQTPGTLATCPRDAKTRVGEWRYALTAPLYSPVEDVSASELAAMWHGLDMRALQMTADTRAALATVLGPDRVEVVETPDPARWAIVPADQLLPNTKVVTVGGKHPLGREPGPLALPLCGPSNVIVRNIDPNQLTTLAMTGVTAMARGTAALMDDKGVTYPVKDVEPWLRDADVVHISNEVSFVPKCDTKRKATMEFCSKESYIELLEAAHAKIIELDGSHLSDYGRQWINHTVDMYQAHGWRWFGGGRDEYESTRPLIYEHHGNKLAFIGCNTVRLSWKVITPGPEVAGCDFARIEWQVRDLRRRGYMPIVAVQHEEVYVHMPPDVLIRDFRRMAEAGAAFVFGSQSHCAHPWEIHYGSFIHYGPGNFFFDQMQSPHTREAANDLLYIYHNRLLTVGHLFTETEEAGRPRVMTDRERTAFLREMTDTLAKMSKSKPTATPKEVPASPARPDSFFLKNVQEKLTVTVPPELEADTTHVQPLVIECGGSAAIDRALVATPAARCTPALVAAITEFMVKKYRADPNRVTTVSPPVKARATRTGRK